MTYLIMPRSWDDPAGVALRAAQRAELDERYGSDDHEPGTPPSAADIDLFVVAFTRSDAGSIGSAGPSDPSGLSGDARSSGSAGPSDPAGLSGFPAGDAIGCGALRALDSTGAEIKRMYVVPGHRGSGVAAALLRTLEEAALARGFTTVRLETGTAQPDAIRFYERAGYTRIPLFGAYVGSDLSLCYERTLR